MSVQKSKIAMNQVFALVTAGLMTSMVTTAVFADGTPPAKRVRCETAVSERPASGLGGFVNPLQSIQEEQKAGTKGYLRPTARTATIEKAFKETRENYLKERNFRIDESPSDILRMVDLETYTAYMNANPGASPLHYRGVEDTRSWKDADDYLTGLADADFKPSVELFKTVASYAAGRLRSKGSGLNFWSRRGYLKILPDINTLYLKETLSEERFQTLKSNRDLTFIELPGRMSKEGARRGLILYTLPHLVESRLQNLVSWYESAETKLDPILLAAEFQHRLISIHPFVDGNARIARLLSDRILLKQGLPPALLMNHDMEITTDVKDLAVRMRVGVADSANLLIRGYRSAISRLYLHSSSIEMFNDAVPHEVQLLSRRFAKVKTYSFRVGSHLFELGADGFMWDQFGIPHEYHEGTFYPIADRFIEYYDFGGTVKSRKVRQFQAIYNERDWSIKGQIQLRDATVVQRELSPLKSEIYASHIRLVENLKSGSLKADALKVAPVDAIRKANREGEAYIYPWQEKEIAQLLAQRSEKPENILAPFYASETSYAKLVTAGKSPDASTTLAQYESIDLGLAELSRAARSYPKIMQAIEGQRESLHQAARLRIDTMQAALAKLSPQDRTVLNTDFRFQLFDSYLKISKLNYKTYDEALAAGADNYVPLMRDASNVGSKFGFLPTAFVHNLITKIPFFERLLAYTGKLQNDFSSPTGIAEWRAKLEKLPLPAKTKKELLAKFDAKSPQLQDGITQLRRGLLLEPGSQVPYTIAGERRVFDFTNRSGGGDTGEIGTSFSTNPGLYFGGNVFAHGELSEVGLSLVKAPRKKVALNFASNFMAEYEVIAYRPVWRTAIVKKYSGVEMAKHLTYGENPVVDAFILKQLGSGSLNPDKVAGPDGGGEGEPGMGGPEFPMLGPDKGLPPPPPTDGD